MRSRSRRIRDLLASGRGRWRLLSKTWLLLWTTRLSLRILPFRTTRRLITRVSKSGSRATADPETAQRVAAAVRSVSRFVPGGSHCLSQAITTQVLLRRRNIDAEICFGVASEASRDFLAHAWVESGGSVVIGEPEPGAYTRLVPKPLPESEQPPSDEVVEQVE